MYKVLVIEDDRTLREAYALLLTLSGYSVSTAVDGKDGLTQYKAVDPHLILLDMLMPNLDGLGFLREYNRIEHLNDTKIIIFSNLSNSKDITTAKELGAEKHIIKAQLTPKQLLSEREASLQSDPRL
jgi:CRP/FNR family cyclic AMP-dependent transcriptional regulator